MFQPLTKNLHYYCSRVRPSIVTNPNGGTENEVEGEPKT